MVMMYGGVPLVINTGIVSSGIPGESVLSCQVHIEGKYAMHACIHSVLQSQLFMGVCPLHIVLFERKKQYILHTFNISPHKADMDYNSNLLCTSHTIPLGAL